MKWHLYVGMNIFTDCYVSDEYKGLLKRSIPPPERSVTREYHCFG